MGIPNIEDVIISLHNDFETNDKLQDKIYDLEQQLQAYKQKEDKLREYCKEYGTKIHEDNGNDIEYYKGYNAGCKDTIYDVNSILNEGDK